MGSGKFRFTKLDLGSEKPQWTNVTVHKSKEDGRRIVIDFDFVYNGDCDIEVKILGITSGVSTITMEGRARLILSPIIKRMPLVGGMQFQFLSLPAIGYQFDGIADLADLPGVKSKIRKGLEKKDHEEDCVSKQSKLGLVRSFRPCPSPHLASNRTSRSQNQC
eukprot:TRINITY_DN25594_c0_g1_i1.p1 TRINITY_DN25594_c0_g1~~TRINITY_DN25594_c0_g1_i1.p1  ORF type:complete len:178 (+),score=55.61 TRINITY_DN25594_c0_g1_i1:48-536(+)